MAKRQANLFTIAIDSLARDRSGLSSKSQPAAEGPLRTLWPRCLTTQGAATGPTALAPGPQRPRRPHCWRNGWRNGWQVTAPPGLPAASPAELGGGALPAALPDGGVWLADGSSESWWSPMGVGQAATRRAAHGGHLRLSPPQRCSSPPHSGCPRRQTEPPTHLAAAHELATAHHHGWPRRAGMVPLGTAQLRRYLVLAWRVLALHALESPTLPLRPERPRSSSSWPLHSRCAGGGFGRLVKAACQAGGLGLVRAHLCIKRPPGRAAATIAARMVQTC